jgi:hypothetical protein
MMANLFLESFDNIATADLILKGYTSINAFTNVTIGAGRTGNGIALDSYGFGQLPVNKILPINATTIIFGDAFKTSSAFPTDQKIWSFSDGITDQVQAWMDAAGRLKFTSPTGTVLGYSTPALYQRNSYYYFEFKIVFSTSATGSINYRVNGVAQPAITGIQTAYSGNAFCNIVRLWLRDSAYSDVAPYYHDDMYANDATGAVNNDYMGDVRIFVQRPFGSAGTAWTANGAGTNLGCVSETTPDADTTYISSSTVNQIDLYTLTTPPASLGVVKAVQSNVVARKDDGITRQIAPVLGDGTHANNVGVTVSVGNGYVDYLQCYDINPLTGAAWAVADLSTLRLGVKEIV